MLTLKQAQENNKCRICEQPVHSLSSDNPLILGYGTEYAHQKCLRDHQSQFPEKSKVDKIIHNFTYHQPKGNQVERYKLIRDMSKDLALFLNIQCPDSREKSLALTKLEESIFWANASIARNE